MSAPNPLRPYYIPPSPSPSSLSSTPLAPPALSSAPAPSSAPPAPSSASFSLLSDLHDYSDYLDTPSPNEIIRSFLTQAAVQYSLGLVAQPFENGKTVLQCRVVPKRAVLGATPQRSGKEKGKGKGKGKQRPSRGWNAGRTYTGASSDASDASDDDGDDDGGDAGEDSDAASTDSDPPYFASEDDDASRSPERGRKMTDRAGYVLPAQEDPDTVAPWQIQMGGRESSVGDVMKAMWAKEGAWGIWKGQNATFVYSVLLRTLDSWTGSFLSALLSLPDLGTAADIADSTHPLSSFLVAVAASTLTAVALAPLDIVRTRLILTPTTSHPRTLLPSLRLLQTHTCPPSLLLATTLHALLPGFIAHGTPYLLHTHLRISAVLSPTLFALCSFLGSSAELAVRLPLETVLRRAQVGVLPPPPRTLVEVGAYRGVFATMWGVVREEEGGVAGLYRGWKLGLWTNVGVLGLELVGGQGGGGEF